MNLREYLEEYRALTLDLMDEIQKDGQISSLLDEREYIIELINGLNFDKEEIKIIGNSLNLAELEAELQLVYKKEKVKVKNQMENIKKARQVNTNYNTIENTSRVFNRTI
jgi:Spy/CpxP family protein refolding chaperone